MSYGKGVRLYCINAQLIEFQIICVYNASIGGLALKIEWWLTNSLGSLILKPYETATQLFYCVAKKKKQEDWEGHIFATLLTVLDALIKRLKDMEVMSKKKYRYIPSHVGQKMKNIMGNT